MWYWYAKAGEWITILTQLAAMIAAIGISLNALHIIVEYSIHGSGHVVGSVIYRIIGIAFALMLVLQAPAIVNDLAPLVKQTLIK